MQNITVELFADGLVKPFPAVVWLGGYALIYYTGCGDMLCASCATKQYDKDTWDGDTGKECVDGCDVLWEGSSVFCAACEVEIKSAYGEDEDRYVNDLGA